MNHPICDSCETVNHCLTHGCIPVQKLKPCRSPYCECSHNVCAHPGYYDARSEPFEHPADKYKLTDQTIRKIFESHGQYLSGKELAMLRVIELMLERTHD